MGSLGVKGVERVSQVPGLKEGVTGTGVVPASVGRTARSPHWMPPDFH
jgi:hypothetical protein